ncbi:hypothetical protein [Rubritalea tangerina]|uniref:hypothetical protein n=1 Tax=Rubritalea tangerina TaxID=430798 RepID=UPI003613A812
MKRPFGLSTPHQSYFCNVVYIPHRTARSCTPTLLTTLFITCIHSTLNIKSKRSPLVLVQSSNTSLPNLPHLTSSHSN